jgi:hypothetical protein
VDVQVKQRSGRSQEIEPPLDELVVTLAPILVNLAPTGPFHVFPDFIRILVAQQPLLIQPMEGL